MYLFWLGYSTVSMRENDSCDQGLTQYISVSELFLGLRSYQAGQSLVFTVILCVLTKQSCTHLHNGNRHRFVRIPPHIRNGYPLGCRSRRLLPLHYMHHLNCDM